MSQPTDLAIDVQSSLVTLRTSCLGVASSWETVREFIGRLLSSAAVNAVTVDRTESRATLHLAPNAGRSGIDVSARQPLRSIAESMRHPSLNQYQLSPVYRDCSSFQIRKENGYVTAGSMVSQTAERIRLRHPLLKGNTTAAKRVAHVISLMPAVKSVSISPLTGSVLVRMHTGVSAPTDVLSLLERVLTHDPERDCLQVAGPPVSQWVAAGGCLGLAVVSDLFVPGIGVLTASALVANNLKTLARGTIELFTLRWKISSLYTVIMGTTLVSGQFLAAALMQASVTAWHGWTTGRLRKSVRELELSSQMTDGWQQVEGLPDNLGSTERRLRRGSVVRVPVGAVLPFDGVVVGGEGDIDEHGLRGIRTFAHCRSGDTVFAGSELLNGALNVQVRSLDERTRLSRIHRTIHSLVSETIGDGGATKRGKDVASRFVPLTFATGSAALLAGDITTLAAVLRPDFCTGPSLSDRLATLTGASHLLHEGWLVKSSHALHALQNVRTIVVADIVRDSISTGSTSEPGDAEQLGRLQAATVQYRKITGDFPEIGVHTLRGTFSECLDYVRNLRGIDDRMAVVACKDLLMELASDELIRISESSEECLDDPVADFVCLHPGGNQIETLFRITHESFRPGQGAWSLLLACNALSITGAFLVGLTSLHVVVITNLGALAAGMLYNRRLKRSEGLIASHARRKSPSPVEQFADQDSSDTASTGEFQVHVAPRSAVSERAFESIDTLRFASDAERWLMTSTGEQTSPVSSTAPVPVPL